MHWDSTIRKDGFVTQSQQGQVADPFWALAMQAKADGMPISNIESKVSHWGNHISVSFSVSLQCPQSQPCVEAAAQLAFVTATRFVNGAVSRMDSSMPLLPTV